MIILVCVFPGAIALAVALRALGIAKRNEKETLRVAAVITRYLREEMVRVDRDLAKHGFYGNPPQKPGK